MAGTIKKNADGYNYKYTDIAGIHEYLESKGYSYYQYIERIGEDDYVFTVPTIDGEEKAPRQGCRIVIAPFDKKSNPAQEQGSGITYARRYSLLMAFGLATSDDDAQCMTREKRTAAFPNRDELIEVAKKHYPKGSDVEKKLLNGFQVGSMEELSDDQLKAVYSKYCK